MSKLTEEEVKYNSIFATQKSLVELGAKQQEKKSELQNIENRYIYLENEIKNNLNNKIITTKISSILYKRSHNDKVNSLLEIFNIYNEFFIMNKDLISNLENYNNKIEDNYNTLREENNITNKEYEEKQVYWEDRVRNLRDKCKDRNKEIEEYKKKDLYNTYNISIKNCLLLIISIFNIDLTNFIYDYIFFLIGLIIYSIYSNKNVILNYKTKIPLF